jgi:hypothetical protein
MKSITKLFSGLLLSAALLLSGCGGGSVDVVVDAGPPPIAFDVVLFASGVQVPGVEVLPGEEQTVYLRVGQSFILDSSNPVAWSVVVGGQGILGTGNTIFYGGATVLETRTTNFEFEAQTFLTNPAPLPVPVPLTFYATSLSFPGQVAKINIVLTN